MDKKIIEQRPIVQCITNIVTVNDCANALLAVGASPTMAHHKAEVAEIQSKCNALVCNLGATENYDAMLIAAKQAKESGHPMVIDPVGCGGSSFRRSFFNELIDACRPAAIRGNYAEIIALAEHAATVTGVDCNDYDKAGDIEAAALKLAQTTGAIVIASGITDVIASTADDAKGQIGRIDGGDIMMSRITGTGCMFSSLLGAFLAVNCSVDSAKACCILMKQAGEKAAFATRQCKGGNLTFRDKFIDMLYKE